MWRKLKQKWMDKKKIFYKCSEPRQISKMECFAKIVNSWTVVFRTLSKTYDEVFFKNNQRLLAVNYFRKNHRCLTGFQISRSKININIPPTWVFFMFFKLYKWYQIAQRITYVMNNNSRKKYTSSKKYIWEKYLSNL